MPNEDVKFSELPVGTLASDSIFATSENDGIGGLISTGVSAADVGNFTIDNLQYPLKLDTENKKVAGAINEVHSSIGANTYDENSTYNKGDTVIYNGTMYTCKGTSVTGTWDATKWDATTLQPKTDNTLDTTAKTITGAINELNKLLTPIGTIVNGTKNATVFTRTWGQKGYIILNKGKWIVFIRVLLQQDSNGYRAMNLAQTSGNDTPQAINMAINGNLTSLNLSTILNVTADNTTFYWNAVHNSTQNSELTIDNYIFQAIRIA